MIMNPEQDQFQQLRGLLLLKRYEQPPPGYFENFSSQVIARLRLHQSKAKGSWLSRFTFEAPWLEGLWGTFEARPMLAGAFGVAVCGLLAVGLLFSDAPASGPANVPAMASTLQPFAADGNSSSDNPAVDPIPEPASVTPSRGPSQSLFQDIARPRSALVNYTVPVRAN